MFVNLSQSERAELQLSKLSDLVDKYYPSPELMSYTDSVQLRVVPKEAQLCPSGNVESLMKRVQDLYDAKKGIKVVGSDYSECDDLLNVSRGGTIFETHPLPHLDGVEAVKTDYSEQHRGL